MAGGCWWSSWRAGGTGLNSAQLCGISREHLAFVTRSTTRARAVGEATKQPRVLLVLEVESVCSRCQLVATSSVPEGLFMSRPGLPCAPLALAEVPETAQLLLRF